MKIFQYQGYCIIQTNDIITIKKFCNYLDALHYKYVFYSDALHIKCTKLQYPNLLADLLMCDNTPLF